LDARAPLEGFIRLSRGAAESTQSSAVERKDRSPFTRKDGRSAIAKPEVGLRDVGLVFHPTETVDSRKIKTLVKSQLEAAARLI